MEEKLIRDRIDHRPQISEVRSAEVLAPKCSTINEEMTKDTDGTVKIGNSKSSCNHFMVSAYVKNCKININVNKGMNMMFSLKNALLLLIREGVNKSCLFILVSLFEVFKYVLLIFQLRNELTRD